MKTPILAECPECKTMIFVDFKGQKCIGCHARDEDRTSYEGNF